MSELSVTIRKEDVACMVASAARLIEGIKDTVTFTVDQYTTPEKALEWMLDNYEVVAGAVYSVAELLELPVRWLLDTEG